MALNSTELKTKTVEELTKLLVDARTSIADARFKIETRELKDMSVIKKAKKTVARVLTELAKRAQS